MSEPRTIRVFLSAVSDEFGAYRDLLRSDLTRPNVEVKVQEDFKDLGYRVMTAIDALLTRPLHNLPARSFPLRAE